MLQASDGPAVRVEKPTLAQLQKVTKLLLVHGKWQDLIYRGLKTWELRSWPDIRHCFFVLALGRPIVSHPCFLCWKIGPTRNLLPTRGHGDKYNRDILCIVAWYLP